MMNFLDDYGFKIPEIPGWAGFCPQYQTVYDAFFEPPPADIAQQQDIMVRALIAAGVWAKLDVFYVFANLSPVDSQVNWITPGTYDMIPVNMVAGDFVAYRGWTGDGIAKYLRTQYNPSIHAINYALNNASFGIYIRDNVAGCNDHAIGGGTAHYSLLRPLSTTNMLGYFLNTTSLSTVGNLETRGFYIVNRLAAPSQQCYKNGAQIDTENDVSTGLTDKEMYILNDSFTNNPYNAQCSAAYFGGGLDEVGNSEITNFTNALETYLDYIGAGVIP